MLTFLQVKRSYSRQCAYLTLLMIISFYTMPKWTFLRRKVYADVRNIILKHICLLRDPLCLLRRLAIERPSTIV